MLRAVLDANVIISAWLRPAGPPGRIVASAVADPPAFEIVSSPAIADEIQRALSYPKIAKHRRGGISPDQWFESILAMCDLVSGTLPISGIRPDPDDDKYVAAAVEAGAAFVVTGDRDLLAVAEFRAVRIASPASFLRLFA